MADFIRDELENADDMPRREPHAGDPIYIHGDRRTILAVTEAAVMTDDDAGLRLQIPRGRMWWDGAAFRTWQS